MRRRRREYTRPNPDRAKVEVRGLTRTALVTLAVALVPFAIFLWMWVRDMRLANGPQVEADIVAVSPRDTGGAGLPRTSSVKVRFQTPDGTIVRTTVRSTRRSFGKTVAITYDEDDPTHARAVSYPELAWRVPLVIALAILWLAALAGWMAFRLHIGRPSRLHLRSRVARDDDINPEPSAGAPPSPSH